MLTIPERYKVLKFFRICSIIGPLPTRVDLTNWELKKASPGKQRISSIAYTFFVLHSLYKNGSLLYAYFFVLDVPLYQLVVHAVVALASAVCMAYWYFVVYIRDATLFARYVTVTLLGKFGGSVDLNDLQEKRWTKRLHEYSRQDLIATMLPYIAVISVPVISASYVYDPSIRLLLYSALPRQLQNWATFGLCLVEEVRFLMNSVTIATPIWQLQVISLDLVSNQLQLLVRTIQNGAQSARCVFMSLRNLQLYISMLNNVNSYLIFTWKLMSIFLSIMAGYAALAHFHEHPVFGIMYYVILLDCTLTYTFIYEKAFKIPQLFDQAAACARLHVRGNRAAVFRRQMSSIPPTGIQVGNFHKMERASTLIFMNYVVINIVNLLVAYD